MTQPQSVGITIVSIAPLYASAKNTSEQVSQILAGEHVKALEIGRGNWVKIKSLEDSYEGWADVRQFDFEEHEAEERGLLYHPMSKWIDDRTQASLWLPAGSLLTEKDNNFYLANSQISYSMRDDALGEAPLTIREAALGFLGAPYQWGGRTVSGIDCSGLVQLSARLVGKKLPRDASDQVDCGENVSWEEREADDIAYFINDKGNVTHVAILVTLDSVVHASGEVRVDRLSHDGIVHAEMGGVTHRLHCIKRLL